jgi:signal transduction histidine kinase
VDNGKGFAADEAQKKRGLGITGISERARMLGAKYEIHSADGAGTKITLQMNLDEEEKD